MSYNIVFLSQPFAKGRFRTAHLGEYISPLKKTGQCVVKRKKSGFTWDPNGWDMCVKIQESAQSFAQGYVRYCQSLVQPRLVQPLPRMPFVVQPIQPTAPYRITFTKIGIASVNHGPNQIPEYVIFEDYLPGNYQKWVNNCGGISPESDVLPAFSHWSWVHTKGEMMIADLQGIRRDDLQTYILTDPAILTASDGGQLGGADTGIIGMIMFFMNHKCSLWCRDLPRPTWERVMISIPNIQLHISPAQLLLARLANLNTVFVQELANLDPYIKATVIRLFKQIAQGN